MKTFLEDVLSTEVKNGEVAVFFLGQAGYLFKTKNNKLIALDPYFSDCCNRHFGFKRLMPYIVDAKDLDLDYLLISHGHYDHFDQDSVPVLMEKGKTELIGALDVKAECENLGITKNTTFMAIGDEVVRDEFKVIALPCDHGELAPDALGLLIEIEGKKIYYMGDTAYRPDLLENPLLKDLDLLILPINGAFGNLDENTAVEVIKTLNPKLSVPCHFWNFIQHGSNPIKFAENMADICPDKNYIMMRQGEGMII